MMKTTRTYYRASTIRRKAILGLLAGLLVLVFLYALSTGAAAVGPLQAFWVLASRLFPAAGITGLTDLERIVILEIRLPRALMAVVAGGALACAGVVMQGVLQNPLVSPYTLGLSSGAAFGAALAIVLQVGLFGSLFGPYSGYMITFNAFIFGTLTMVIVFGIASLKGTTPETLILAGVAIGYLFSALVSALQYISDVQELPEIVFWLMGGLLGTGWDSVLLVLPVLPLAFLIMMRYAWDLNALGAGEEVAASLGVEVRRVKIGLLLLSAVVTASIVAFTGIIGFIGLVAPHLMRMIIGSDHRYLIPGAGLTGGLLLLIADTLARTIMAPTEIPVGILTSLLGAPFFLYLLLKRRRAWWN